MHTPQAARTRGRTRKAPPAQHHLSHLLVAVGAIWVGAGGRGGNCGARLYHVRVFVSAVAEDGVGVGVEPGACCEELPNQDACFGCRVQGVGSRCGVSMLRDAAKACAGALVCLVLVTQFGRSWGYATHKHRPDSDSDSDTDTDTDIDIDTDTGTDAGTDTDTDTDTESPNVGSLRKEMICYSLGRQHPPC